MAPVIFKGQVVGGSIKTEENSKYLVFVNSKHVDVDEFCKCCTGLPGGTIIHTVYADEGQMDDVIRVYETKS